MEIYIIAIITILYILSRFRSKQRIAELTENINVLSSNLSRSLDRIKDANTEINTLKAEIGELNKPKVESASKPKPRRGRKAKTTK